jgi:hypothetical protein
LAAFPPGTPALKAEFVADGVQFDERVDYTSEDGNYFFDYFDRIDRIDPEAFRAYLAQQLTPARALVLVSTGERAQE